MSNAKQIDDGGPAFPIPEAQGGIAPGFGGMSLRDWFAGQALVGNLASSEMPNGNFENEHGLATNCYVIADAMLAARKAGAS